MDKFKNIEYNINFYPSMFNDKYGKSSLKGLQPLKRLIVSSKLCPSASCVQYLSKNNKINIYLD